MNPNNLEPCVIDEIYYWFKVPATMVASATAGHFFDLLKDQGFCACTDSFTSESPFFVTKKSAISFLEQEPVPGGSVIIWSCMGAEKVLLPERLTRTRHTSTSVGFPWHYVLEATDRYVVAIRKH